MTDVLDILLLVGGEELQQVIETLPREPTNYDSHIQQFDQLIKASRNNTLELNKLFNMEWPRNAYFSDFEAQCRQQGKHCEFPINLNQVIIILTEVKARNAELRDQIIRKDGDLKLVTEVTKAYQVAKEESVIVDPDTAHNAQIEGQEVKRISKPGR